MNASKLKQRYETLQPNGHFFERSTLRFFGDTMRNYGVGLFEHEGQQYAELYRRKPVKHGLQSSHYFRLSDMSHSTSSPLECEQ